MPRILVVDDDEMTLKLMGTLCKRGGYDTTVAESGFAAQAILQEKGTAYFEALITDYRMPGFSGMDLYLWVKEQDTTLGTAMVTAEGEKKLVANSMRVGILDFLDKPVNVQELYTALAATVNETRARRKVMQMQTSVFHVGELQNQMSSSGAGRGTKTLSSSPMILMHYQPMHEAGGDFVNSFPLDDETHFLLVADVSGHDLKAAFISAYFQGIVRGMIEAKKPVLDVFEFFNKYLIYDWAKIPSESGDNIPDSLCACALEIQPGSKSVTVLNSGFPTPYHLTADGLSRPVGTGSSPIGWFDELCPSYSEFVEISNGDQFYFWSDGVEDYADQKAVSPLAVAHRILNGPELELGKTTDDILLLRLSLSEPPPDTNTCFFRERLGTRSLADINILQERWQRNLSFVVPDCPDEKLYDFTLVSRELVLNALKHGCKGIPDASVFVTLSWNAPTRTLRLIVDDPGPGFDVKHTPNSGDSIVEEHCGLLLIRKLTTRFVTERNGATAIADFQV